MLDTIASCSSCWRRIVRIRSSSCRAISLRDSASSPISLASANRSRWLKSPLANRRAPARMWSRGRRMRRDAQRLAKPTTATMTTAAQAIRP